MNRRSTLQLFAIVTAAFASAVTLSSPAHADQFPSRLIRIVIPFPAGGLNDNVARILQPSLQQKLGQTVIIENRPGASGIVGTEYVAKAAPDGYTLLMVASSHTVTPATNSKLPYDTEHDLAAVGLVVRDPLLFVVGDKVPAKSLKDFVALAKSEPGKLTYATPGTDSQSHFVTELFDLRAGIKMLRGSLSRRRAGGAVADLRRNAVRRPVDAALRAADQGRQAARAGLRRRYAQQPLPRPADLEGSPATPMSKRVQWVGMLAPGKTPKDVIARINTALRDTLASPDVASEARGAGRHAPRRPRRRNSRR